jgi:hypothetical protein
MRTSDVSAEVAAGRALPPELREEARELTMTHVCPPVFKLPRRRLGVPTTHSTLKRARLLQAFEWGSSSLDVGRTRGSELASVSCRPDDKSTGSQLLHYAAMDLPLSTGLCVGAAFAAMRQTGGGSSSAAAAARVYPPRVCYEPCTHRRERSVATAWSTADSHSVGAGGGSRWAKGSGLLRQKHLTNAVAGAGAGAIAAVVVCPLDVVKTRLQCQAHLLGMMPKYQGLAGMDRNSRVRRFVHASLASATYHWKCPRSLCRPGLMEPRGGEVERRRHIVNRLEGRGHQGSL